MSAIPTAWAGSRQNIEYSRVGGIALQMDAHIPDGKGPFPAVVIVHGGAWVAGDREYNVKPLFKPLEDADIAWFSISYRLASSDMVLSGAAVEDVKSAIRFIKAHAAEYNVDPARMALIGESAGAQLASMAAATAGPEERVNAVVAFYCPSDLVSLARTSPMVPDNIRRAVQNTAWADLLLARLRDLSPIEHVSPDMPPFLLMHGTADTVVPYEQSTAMCARMKQAGASCELFTVEGGGHGIRGWERSAQFSQCSRRMVQWLRGKLEPRVDVHACARSPRDADSGPAGLTK
jgi:acetyl esterase